MIIDFSICRGIFNGNVYVLYLCPQAFFTSRRTYLQFLSAYVGYLSHTFVMELDLLIYFLPGRISGLLQPKLLFNLFCVSFYLKEKYLSFISDSSLFALKSKMTLFCLAKEIFNQVLVQKLFFQMKKFLKIKKNLALKRTEEICLPFLSYELILMLIVF